VLHGEKSEQSRDEKEGQPENPFSPNGYKGRFQIRFFKRRDGCHQVGIASGFLAVDVNDVVVSDDTEHPVFVIHHRNGEKVVFRYHINCPLTFIHALDRNQVPLH
jgi:hypothetical protein